MGIISTNFEIEIELESFELRKIFFVLTSTLIPLTEAIVFRQSKHDKKQSKQKNKTQRKYN